jgi:hypothetical protein
MSKLSILVRFVSPSMILGYGITGACITLVLYFYLFSPVPQPKQDLTVYIDCSRSVVLLDAGKEEQ